MTEGEVVEHAKIQKILFIIYGEALSSVAWIPLIKTTKIMGAEE